MVMSFQQEVAETDTALRCFLGLTSSALNYFSLEIKELDMTHTDT